MTAAPSAPGPVGAPRPIVTRDQLEAGIVRARAASPDPRAGLFGPGSVTWELHREAVNFVGGGRAILMQLAHPFVAHAIDQHSRTRQDARGRFQRTFAGIFAMAFGDLDHAVRAARRVFSVHARIHGTIDEDVGRWRRGARYHGTDAAALLWVHATLLDSVLAVREQLHGPLDPYRARAYVHESRRFAHLFGIPEALLPDGPDALAAYVERTLASDEIAVGRPAREIADFVLRSPVDVVPALRLAARPLGDWYRVVTAGLLPSGLRRAYGLELGRVDRAMFALSMRTLAGAARALPRPLRYLPPYLEAEARLGLTAHRPVLRLLDRVAVRGMSSVWPRAG